MKNLKKIVEPIIRIFLIAFVLLFITSIQSNAADKSNTITTNLNSEFDYKINFGEKIITCDIELQYDSENLEFVSVETKNTEYNVLENGKVVIVYVDEIGEGTDNVIVKFKAKKETSRNKAAEIYISNINLYSLIKDEQYSKEQFNDGNLLTEVKILKQESNISEAERDSVEVDLNMAKGALPYTGNHNLMLIAFGIGTIAVSIIIVIIVLKYKKILPVIIIGLIFGGTLTIGNASEAVSKMFLQRYDKINGYGDIVVVMPNKTNRNITKAEFEERIKDDLDILYIENQEEEGISEDSLVGTGNKAEISDETKYDIIMYGDVNGDGQVNSGDIGLIIKEKVKNEKITGIYRKAANLVNINDQDDEILNSEDIKRFKEYILYKLDTSIVDELPRIVNEDGKTKVQIAYFEINSSENEIKEGEQLQLQTKIMPENATNKTLQWTSSDENIIKVDSNGIVTGVAIGEAQITATTTDGTDLSKTISIAVCIPVEEIQLDTEYIRIDVGDMASIKTTIMPENATNKNIQWSSSNEDVATVNENGNIVGVSGGRAIITAMTENGKKTASVTVDVGVPIEEIKLDNNNIYIREGETYTLSATIIPENTTNKKLQWLSSDENIATVDENGKVTALSEGTCIIMAQSSNGLIAESTVEVLKRDDSKVLAETITLSNNYIDMNLGEIAALDVTIGPENTTNKNVTWTSSDSSIATVDGNGRITAIREGEAQITAITTDGSNLKATATINVTVPVGERVLISYLAIDGQEIELNVGENALLKATVLPEDATNKTLMWFSNNPEIAIVDENGRITAISSGETQITATTTDGSMLTASINIKVNVPVTEIRLNPNNIKLRQGESSEPIQVEILPNDATNKSIQWNTSDENIATIENGIITANNIGNATITATTADGNVSASIEVNVIVPVESISISPNNVSLNKGENYQLNVEITPDNATIKNMKVTISDENVATIDGKGIITALEEGETTILLETIDGSNLSAMMTLRVTVPVTEITLNTYNIYIEEGEEYNIEASINPDNATDKSLQWTSSNNNIATVDENGKVTGIAEGRTIISAQSRNGIIAECEVNVENAYVPDVLAQRIEFDEYIDSMNLGEMQELKVKITPENTTNKKVIWTSSNSSIATIDSNGKLIAKKNGTVQITAKTTDGSGLTAVATVHINILATGLNLDKNNITMEMGDTQKINATVMPSNATNQNIVWTSSNEQVATVDEDGKITAVGIGEAQITATTTDGSNISKNVNVTVLILPTGVTLNKTTTTLDLGGTTKTETLTATVAPSTATNKAVTWATSNNKVATVANGVVTAVGNGTATITATTSNGKTATCTVTVQTSPTGVTLNKTTTTLDLSSAIKTETLTATVAPSTATSNTVTWSSSNTTVATVTNNGVVTAVGNGAAIITARTSNGKTATCTVTVQTSPTGLKLNNTSTTLDLSGTKTATLKATIEPSTANNQTAITWTSGNNNIATVSANGKVTAVANGKATITAETANGKKATCEVTVETSPTKITLDETSINTRKRSEKLTATLEPDTVTKNTVTWTSSNTAVATVSSSGKITTVAPGTATITATTSNGKTATCTVTVTTNILFIGNSKTYHNRMPRKIFQKIAEAGGQNVYVKSITKPDQSLQTHYQERDMLDDEFVNVDNSTTFKCLQGTIEERRWDYVVLQEKTATARNYYNNLKKGATNIVNDLRTNGSPNVQIIYNSVWMDITDIREKYDGQTNPVAKTKTEVATDTKTDSIYKRQEEANKNFEKLTKENGMNGTIAYSGSAFIECWRDTAGYELQLYRSSENDWNHPSVKGSYLEACCIYSAIFGKPSKDIIIDKAWNYYPKTGKDKECTESRATQKTLWNIVRKVQ